MINRRVKIVNQLGLHARAASVLVQTAQKYGSKINVSKSDLVANGKNIMSVMLLAAAKGSTIEISADGDDEAEALAELVELVSDGFGEES